MPEYRYRVLLDAIGSEADIAKVIETYGFEAPSYYTIKGWRMRNSIPSKWMPMILHHVLKEKIITDPTQFFRRPKRKDLEP